MRGSMRRATRLGWMAGALLGLVGCADEAPEIPAGSELPLQDEAMEDHWHEEAAGAGVYSKTLVTVGDLVSNRSCSTEPTMGLNRQIAEEINCIQGGRFSSIADISNLQLGAGANPFLQSSAASALRRAAGENPGTVLQVHSTWRSVVQQYVLKSWEGSCGISVAASPGQSNHESGLAVDVGPEMRASLRRNGWSWYCDRTNRGQVSGCRDIPHWDFYDGQDMRRLSVLAFQRLWNKANPRDRISEDGAYGGQTSSRIRQAPLQGFSTGTTCGADLEMEDSPQPQQPAPQEPSPDSNGEQEALAALIKDARGEPTGTPAAIWRPSTASIGCSTWSMDENFSSGRFNVHRFRAPLASLGELRVQLGRQSGSWQPAIFVTDRRGELIVAGDASGGHGGYEAEVLRDGRSGAVAEATFTNDLTGDVYVFVTSWEVVDAGLEGRLPTSARYTLTLGHACQSGDDQGGASGARGVDFGGLQVPRAGLGNPTLRSVSGVSTERYGELRSWQGSNWVAGGVSWFGGPNDRGVSSTETGAITGERLRNLNSPLNPSASALTSNADDYYYIAMRWNYALKGRSAWEGARLMVVNPETGAAVVVRPVDWGPGIQTSRVMDLSPQALADLDLITDDVALVTLVDPSTPLGRVR
jgi:hypothetical protein